jgi:hypothetical protein
VVTGKKCQHVHSFLTISLHNFNFVGWANEFETNVNNNNQESFNDESLADVWSLTTIFKAKQSYK